MTTIQTTQKTKHTYLSSVKKLKELLKTNKVYSKKKGESIDLIYFMIIEGQKIGITGLAKSWYKKELRK